MSTPAWNERSPVIRITNQPGLRFGLNEDEFSRWWSSIHPEDQESFLYHNGDELLARFVCCFDYFLAQGKRGAVVAAYATALAKDPNDREVQKLAEVALEHPATQDLLDRLNYRETRMARSRIERKYTSKLEALLDADLDADTQAKVVDLAGKFIKQTHDQDERMRRSRDRRTRLSPGSAKALKESDVEDIEQYAEVVQKVMRPLDSLSAGN